METELVIHTLEELKAFLNDNGILEIAMRNQKKRFKNFEKVIIDVAQNGQEKELADKVIQALNKNNLLNQKNLKLLGNIAQMQQLGLLLNGLTVDLPAYVLDTPNAPANPDSN